MPTISLKLSEDLIAKLETEAKATRVTKSELVRQSLRKELHRQPLEEEGSCYDLAQDLAGVISGLPEDLAENPEYTQRFGQ